jgi:predicted RNase H-like HicB family nuclease
MEHKRVRYELLQTVHPSGWKWVAHVSHIKQTTGFSSSKDLAIRAAKRAIEKALAAEEKREGNPF